ncbi:putative membrane protein [Asticcacaulis biprosthecium C19]|uniref:Putative membrane protein n=1 Tax=Asticcacaulis biprosthecium C19 TaxID=715226 RepID=F4QII6_9CAUL|nr:putative membrane protein [Asticcacaulis biprosthecium C19]
MWLGLIATTAVGSLILMTFVLALTLGTLNVIQQITHYFGW